jgi:hypothetical protein
MPFRDSTPFDPPTDPPPSLRIYLAPSAIAAATAHDLAFLRRIDAFDYFDIVLVPGSDTQKDQVVREELLVAGIAMNADVVSVLVPGAISMLGWREMYDTWVQRTGSAEYAVEYLLLRTDRLYDIVVVASDSPSLSTGDQETWHICDLKGLRTRLRLYQADRAYFESQPKCFIDKSIYLMIRRERCFPGFVPAWRAACSIWENHQHAVVAQLSSLHMRLIFACDAQDRAIVASLRQSTTASAHDCLYHLIGLVLVATGALEDLAWILHRIYPSSIHLQGITLRCGRKGQSKLLPRIQRDNPSLYSALTLATVRDGIEGLFAIRDQLQHRGLPKTIDTSYGGARRPTGHIVVSQEIVNQLARAMSLPSPPFSHARAAPADRMCDPYWLSEATFAALRLVVDSVLPRLPWQTMIAALPEHQRANYERLMAAYIANPWTPYEFADPCLY